MISNTLTLLRTCLAVPVFLLLATGGSGLWAAGLFLLAGALDMLDGRLARALNEVSPLGAFLDLVGDRLLTLSAVSGLMIAGQLPLAAEAACTILIARDLIFASIGEAASGKVKLTPAKLEPVKIALSFSGLAAGMLQPDWPAMPQMAGVLLPLAALVSMVTLIGYVRHARVP